jgi:hypothetical protein
VAFGKGTESSSTVLLSFEHWQPHLEGSWQVRLPKTPSTSVS